jgi:uncharacterized protein (TIGR02246 family)
MRTHSIVGALAALVLSFAACGGSPASSTEQAVQREADRHAIEQIEAQWHKATSSHDIDLMMSLWAPNATFTVSPGKTLSGVDEIRAFWLETRAFQPGNEWVSETPSYKIRVTVDGNRGTLYFECHYVDAETAEVVATTAADAQVARIDGRWLITNNVGATAILSP